MAGEIIKQRYYFLTPLSFLLGILVLVATLLLAVASYPVSYTHLTLPTTPYV